MAHEHIDLNILGTEAFVTWEDGIGTVLWVIHDRSNSEEVHALRQELNELLEPSGRYNRYRLKSKSEPNSEWI